MKYTISKFIICLSLLITASSHAELTEDGSFEVFTNNGERVQYSTETQILSIFDINGQLKASGETVPVTTVASSEATSSFTRSYSINTPKENFTVSISTVGLLKEAKLEDTGRISRAGLVQRSHRNFLGHKFTSSIHIDEFSKNTSPEVSFSITTASNSSALYDAKNNTMTVSDREGKRFWANRPVKYSRRYKGNIAIHSFSVSKGSQTYTVEFIAEIIERKLHLETLLQASLIPEKPGVILSERFLQKVELSKVTIKSPKCRSIL